MGSTAPFSPLPTPMSYWNLFLQCILHFSRCQERNNCNSTPQNLPIELFFFSKEGLRLSVSSDSSRGVPWLDVARGKKQVWCPMFEHKVFRKQMYCIGERACDIVGTFCRPPHWFGWFGARRIVPRLALLVTPLDSRSETPVMQF